MTTKPATPSEALHAYMQWLGHECEPGEHPGPSLRHLTLIRGGRDEEVVGGLVETAHGGRHAVTKDRSPPGATLQQSTRREASDG